MENVALFFHLLGAFLFVGGTLVAGIAFEAGRRRDSPSEIRLLLGLARFGALAVVGGASLVLGFGLWLVHLGNWGYDAGWVDAAIGLFAVAVVLGAVGGQAPKRARWLATNLADEDRPLSDELRRLLSERWALAANYGSALIVLAIIALMVWKPGATHS
jgi:uncharacterized membrane protein